ncbi:MAG TPA: hypothetical protein VM008_07385 [Phycisphaerae bacterium]|nr:hypothetical protein [Phycisphaerae bacterium]
MSLAEWVKFGWLRTHAPTQTEIHELLAVADRDIHDAQTRGLSTDWQFGIAYNAALQLARAALLAAGYDTQKGDSHHFRAIDSLQFTLRFDGPSIAMFQTFRKKRSAGVYEATGMISDADAKEMLALAKDLRARVQNYLNKNHPDLA